jgi:hypothetical protein
MTSYLPAHAQAFRDQFIQAESALRKAGFVDPKRKRSMVAWELFAEKLDAAFFDKVRDSGKAATLIDEPPRAFFREEGWKDTGQRPLTTIVELFDRGVCQVRNNIEHGLKYIDPEANRSEILIREATWVLAEAVNAVPPVRELFEANAKKRSSC